MAPISKKFHRYPRPRWKYTPYLAKRPGYVPPAQRENPDGKVTPYLGFRMKDERTAGRKRGLGGPYTRLSTLQDRVTELVKLERLMMSYAEADETRKYIERIIHTARFGPKDPEAMKLADFYINEKHLIYKLFSVIVPRFEQWRGGEQYTRMYRVPPKGDGLEPKMAQERCVLEIVGHPFPAMEPAITQVHENNLLNVLLSRLRERFEERHRRELNSLTGAAATLLRTPNRVDAYETEHNHLYN